MGKYVGTWIRQVREKKQWSQAELANKLKLKNSQVVSSIELGKIPLPPNRIPALAKTFRVSRKQIVLTLTREFRRELTRAVHSHR